MVDRHLNVPFAYPALRGQLRQAAVDDIRRYLNRYRDELSQTIHSELPVQITIAPGVTVDGRIDLIRRLDTGETCIVDFKSTERAQSESVTRDQLHVYALGYQELTGTRADNIVEILNLDRNAQNVREVIDPALLEGAARRIDEAGHALRQISCRGSLRGAVPALRVIFADCAGMRDEALRWSSSEKAVGLR